MTGNNFIDWNGDGRLDPQDLATGVAMDTVEENEKHENLSNEQPQHGASGCLGCGCMLNALTAITVVLFGAGIAVFLL